MKQQHPVNSGKCPAEYLGKKLEVQDILLYFFRSAAIFTDEIGNMGQIALDRIDRKILEILQHDGRITNAELSQLVGLSASPCHARVKKLEAGGIISGYSAIIDPRAAGYEICAFILVQINDHTRKAGDDFAAAIKKAPMVAESHMISGKLDYLLRVYARNLDHYEAILRDYVSELPNISSIESLFVLNSGSSRFGISIDH